MALKDSLERALQLLERHGVIEYIRRDIATRKELEHYLRAWDRTVTTGRQLGFIWM